MRKISFVISSALVVFVVANQLIAHSHAKNSDQFIKIINGDEVEPGAYPFMVSLHSETYGEHFCGASLIHEQYVLTAGHCTADFEASDLKVVLGLHERANFENALVVEVAEVIEHPDYDGRVDFDFSLLKLASPVDANRFPTLAYNTTKLEEDEIEDGIMSTTMGWGVTEENREADVLMEVDVPLVSQRACRKAYSFGLTDAMICAGYKRGGKDACQGDSGGPLVIEDEGELLLVGTVSWGHGCARPNAYGVYGRVSMAAEWIDEVIGVSPR